VRIVAENSSSLWPQRIISSPHTSRALSFLQILLFYGAKGLFFMCNKTILFLVVHSNLFFVVKYGDFKLSKKAK